MNAQHQEKKSASPISIKTVRKRRAIVKTGLAMIARSAARSAEATEIVARPLDEDNQHIKQSENKARSASL